MWRVGFLGLGKLGLPVAVAMASRGVDVVGYDTRGPAVFHSLWQIETGPDGCEPYAPWQQRALEGGPEGGRLRFGTLEEVAGRGGVVFVAVQTPHDPQYEGITRVPDQPQDFDYTWLTRAVEAIVAVAASEPTVVVIVSTVLPGTCAREIIPRLPPTMRLVYNPSFIAMGTTMRDFLAPEFVLLGADDPSAVASVAALYEAILPGVPRHVMSISSAELTKVAYNTAISQKLVLANTLMEICHKTPGANVDHVTGALKAATRRVVGPAYLDGGMGDGGSCHPRDNIAMQWLARQLDLSYDPFRAAMVARERQTEWLRDLVLQHRRGLPVVLLGYAYKPGTNLTAGSPALLLHRLLAERGVWASRWDPYVDPTGPPLAAVAAERPACLVLGCRHPELVGWNPAPTVAKGSVIIDPFRVVRVPPSASRSITVVPVGIGPTPTAA